MTNTPRYAAWADPSTQNTDGTFYVAICEANRPGYWTLNSGWPTLEAAQNEAQRVNELRGLDTDAVLDIRASSMAEHTAGWRSSDDSILYGTDSPTTDTP